tara:strand:+ start:1858 stop:2475 length:618 start_codon:yes stop_codon:yes gene_type:complete
MGKNASAVECVNCGNLIYYGGRNPCCNDGYEEYLEQVEVARFDAEQYVMSAFEDIVKERLDGVPHDDKTKLQMVAFHNTEFHDAIWYASTEILPNLEVQVVIDAKNDCYVSSGSAGFVDFGSIPKGMKMPVKCWIHTHPFGSAYFSGTDIRTVSIWQPLMEMAYVLGGKGHYGFWENRKPKQLDIYVNHELERTQTWNQYGNEEE